MEKRLQIVFVGKSNSAYESMNKRPSDKCVFIMGNLSKPVPSYLDGTDYSEYSVDPYDIFENYKLLNVILSNFNDYDRITINVTGSTKPQLVSVCLYMYIFKEKRQNVELIYLPHDGDLIDFPLVTAFLYMELKTKGRRGRPNDLKYSIISILKGGEKSLSDLVNILKKKKPTISRALKDLIKLGLVKSRKEFRNSVFWIDPAVKQVIDVIDGVFG